MWSNPISESVFGFERIVFKVWSNPSSKIRSDYLWTTGGRAIALYRSHVLIRVDVSFYQLFSSYQLCACSWLCLSACDLTRSVCVWPCLPLCKVYCMFLPPGWMKLSYIIYESRPPISQQKYVCRICCTVGLFIQTSCYFSSSVSPSFILRALFFFF